MLKVHGGARQPRVPLHNLDIPAGEGAGQAVTVHTTGSVHASRFRVTVLQAIAVFSGNCSGIT